MIDDDDNEVQPSSLPVVLPCLLWEPTLDAIVLATGMGTGTVLKAGHSQVLKVGMVIPYAANRWSWGGEEWDFILPPPDLRMTLKNVCGHASRPKCLDVQVEYGQDHQPD